MSIDQSKYQHGLAPKTCVLCGGTGSTLGQGHTAPSSATRVLSLREKQIVKLIQEAKSNKEIAFELCLTVGTVKEYVYHIFRKLGMTNRTELALWGRELSNRDSFVQSPHGST